MQQKAVRYFIISLWDFMQPSCMHKDFRPSQSSVRLCQLDVPSSWRENSCDSDPGGGDQHGHRETLTSKHS